MVAARAQRGYWYGADGAMAVLAALRRFRRADEEMRQRTSVGMGMNRSDIQALQHVIAAEQEGTPITPRLLADHLRISSASTTKLLDRLTASGHLERAAHPHDRRSVVVRATPHAHREIRERLGRMHERMAEIARDVPEHCRDAVVDFLEAMAAELDRAGVPEPLTPAGDATGGRDPAGKQDGTGKQDAAG
ncbi:MarR family transcriptional regulator [Georgenia sp. TF02-10]|uniref:MarR family winged helix-turn-helix transcriptional regulator n=1 Tax=Georgenia sp. TF02-10 TaxID=2917725 RepID=UPI001FA6B103|nr:MarR family transcriptional regulator [Georgenia sp. TF02-10]UNX54841.1 MarR family transcriptional regulator [Georgenia sp. TF02-10]